jgi:DNA-3-methyladenine glycosylase I
MRIVASTAKPKVLLVQHTTGGCAVIPGRQGRLVMSSVNASGLWTGPDRITRCFWCRGSDDYIGYHDTEWGFPVRDDRRLFEKISLEGFQSGLSWLIILRKRDNFRRAFADFDFTRVARFTARDVHRLLNDAGIVRHRGKIESTINNAKRCVELVDEFGSLAAYVWRFEPDPGSRAKKITWNALKGMGQTPESRALSKDLRARGWSFVGPTTMYAFMQAMGLVNDHLYGCAIRKRIQGSQVAGESGKRAIEG